jgi:hypothetical protein
MKKETKRLFAILFAFVFVFTALCFTASAENENKTSVEAPANEALEGEAANAENQNVFEIIYREGMKHSDKILSLLAFITSLVLTLTYKKSLIPIVRGTLSKLGASVNKITEDAESNTQQTLISLNEAKVCFEESKAIFKSVVNMLESLYAKLDESIKLNKINNDIKILMQNQIDMLYEVFISSSLPLYQKEAVGE